ncbi:unnamed protein product [Thelazia callipaeda]|uniref:DNA 3'-5' helicase n=1 Tax=Thelazia callipaeda TaxID=103827 RepID=A0A0N5DBD4_THECL|nr:unnamed protein product [Thelazia callipaeda]
MLLKMGTYFRSDLKFLKVLKCQFRGVPLLSLTATATDDVIDDVRNMLEILDFKPLSNVEFKNVLMKMLKTRFAKLSEIIYSIKAAYYHAFMDSQQRSSTHKKWLSRTIIIIVAPIAFGEILIFVFSHLSSYTLF